MNLPVKINAMQELAALRDRSVALDAAKHDHVMAASAMLFDQECELQLDDMLPVAFTEHAYRQLFAKLGPGHFGSGSAKPLPYDYLLAHTPEARADLLNDHVYAPGNTGKEWLVRGINQECRAVLHAQYPVIPNTDILDTLIEAIGEQPPPDLRLVRPYVDADRTILRIMWQDTGRDDRRGGHYGIGTFIGNDEIGGGRVKVWPLVQSTGCANSIVFRPLKASTQSGIFNELEGSAYDEEADQRGDFVGLSLVHRGDKVRLALLVKQAIGQSFGASAAFLDKMIRAETQRLPNFNDVLADLGRKYGWSEDTRNAVAVGTHGEETLAGVINGVTFAAQQLAKPTDQADMEALAGTILVAPDSLFGVAARERVAIDRA